MANTFFVVFAALLIALFLDALARPVQRTLRVASRVLALCVVLVAIAAALAALGWQLGPSVADQIAALTDRVPGTLDQMVVELERSRWFGFLSRHVPSTGDLLTSSAPLLQAVPDLFSNVAGAASVLGFVLILGVFAAANPDPYLDGLVRMVPRRGRERAREVIDALGHALRWWLVGRILSMAVVGVLTGVGLWILGVPLAAGLGTIAGILAFVPYLGPIASVVPALLVSFGAGALPMLQVAALYLAVQVVEGNVLTPLIQRSVVSLPPAVMLVAQFAGALSFGLVGILLATPLAVAVVVLVQMLYVEQVLHDPIRVLASKKAGRGAEA